MRLLLILLFLLSPLVYGQKLDAWLTRESEEYPQAYLQEAAKKIPATPTEAAGNFFVLGKSYHYLNQEDTALKYYLIAKKEFEKLNLEEPSKDLALEIHQVISSQENYDKYGNIYLNEYFAYAQKTESDERMALAWNEFAKNAYALFDFEERSNPKVLDSAGTLFQKGLYYANQTDNSLLKAKIYSNIGALESTRQNFTSARQNHDKARALITAEGDRYELFKNYFNYGNSYFLEGYHADAIIWFKKAEAVQLPKFRNKSVRMLYKRLMESYDEINNQPGRKTYQKKFMALDSLIKDEEQNIAIHDINLKYQTAEKDEQISSLEQFKDKFYQNRLVFSILLAFVFLLALYSFIRWKKLDHHKKSLEEENRYINAEKEEIKEMHDKTVQELEKVKSIVTEGYIVLKDKTKVYLNDLMYVKSEDHYLHAYSSSGHNHFVRGKISQILLELPPNFVKCHRSYVVNTNYIHAVLNGYIVLKNKVEIPVSRSFKLE